MPMQRHHTPLEWLWEAFVLNFFLADCPLTWFRLVCRRITAPICGMHNYCKMELLIDPLSPYRQSFDRCARVQNESSRRDWIVAARINITAAESRACSPEPDRGDRRSPIFEVLRG